MAALTDPDESIESFHRRLDGVAYTTYILIMLLVPLKVYCRKRSGGWANVRLDDYLSLLALVFANAFFYVCIIGMRPSLGRHVTTISTEKIIDFLLQVFMGQIFYTFSITTIKLSLLAFYWRLFEVKARITIYVVTAMSLAWCIAIFLCVIFSCIPVQAAWDITITDKTCIPIRSIYLGGSVPNVILDLVLVIMPIPYVLRLHAPVAQRVVLVGMFALGTFIAVVSLVRLIIFLQIPIATQGDATYNFREIIVWSIVEINIGLTCACLPSLKPALSMIGITKLFSFNGSRPSNVQSPGPSSGFPSRNGGYETPGGSKPSTRPRKKGATGGLFSTLAGISKIDVEDQEEDEFKIVEDNVRGKNNVEIELGRVSDDSGQRRGQEGGINVQRNWSVLVDERREDR
ncbi:hypothetical protein BDW02DRAFT_572956 [Decorospora gaudefroyi]|uniref:Rhodopsin domain-containing protein n=1 Tax=Decorospora gaudefroyi TaxID=184978 RepID=A0A6A5JZ90_9PLEO|nr:hypothetical protein BDW02DRAFT_572956 [Decorospora gaudefroyi]